MLKIHLEKVNGGRHCGAYFFGFRQLLIICDVVTPESDTSVSVSSNEICSLSIPEYENIFEGCYKRSASATLYHKQTSLLNTACLIRTAIRRTSRHFQVTFIIKYKWPVTRSKLCNSK